MLMFGLNALKIASSLVGSDPATKFTLEDDDFKNFKVKH